MQKQFPSKNIRRLIIAGIKGKLVVSGWEEHTISVECDRDLATLQVEADALIIEGARDSVVIAVPYEMTIQACGVSGGVSVINISYVDMRDMRKDCFLKGIHGEAQIGRVHGNLHAEDIKTLLLTEHVDKDATFEDVDLLKTMSIGADMSCKNVREAQLQGHVGRDLSVENVEILTVGNIGHDCVLRGNGRTVACLGHVGKDLEAYGLTRLHAKNVGLDCKVHDCALAEIVLHNVGKDLEVVGATSVSAHNVGRTCQLYDIQGNVTVRHVGASIDVAGVSGNLNLGHIGAQAHIRGLEGRIALGVVGGNLEMQAHFPVESTASLYVGGNATFDLSENANLVVYALAGGAIKDEQSGLRYKNGAKLVYGEEQTQLKIRAGGNITLRGAIQVRETGANGWDWQDWGRWKEKSYQWKEFYNQVRMEWRQSTSDERYWSRYYAGDDTHPPYLHICFGEREWRIDPARIERIVETARQAAADGVLGALDAVEQALQNLQLSGIFADDENMPEERAQTADQEQTTASQQQLQASNTESSPVNVDQEREAILRMIAEGRITPDEGDMLLEALNEC